MASPVCLVNALSTLNGVEILDGEDAIISLADPAGVKQWSIQCVYTDELNDKNTINSGLSVDLTTRTATFTGPETDGYGAALIFESKVNNGLDPNGRADPTLTTTFGVFILCGTSKRIHAFMEFTESNAQFGWTPDFNNIIRNDPTLGGLVPSDAGDGLLLVASSLNVVAEDDTIIVNPNSIQVNPGDGLVANANGVSIVAADGSITVNPNSIQVGVINASQHGNQTNGSLHAIATGSVAGFMSAADKTKLDAATASATANTLALRNGSGSCAFGPLSATTIDASSNVGISGNLTLLGSASVGTTLGVVGTTSLATSSTSNISLNASGVSFNSGQSIVYLRDRTTAPISNPSTGLFFYSESGNLIVRNSDGSVTQYGNDILGRGTQTNSSGFSIISEDNNDSRSVQCRSGACTTGGSGQVLFSSGGSTSGNSGMATIQSGNTTSGISGQVFVISGEATSGASGSILVKSGDITSIFTSNGSGSSTYSTGSTVGSGTTGGANFLTGFSSGTANTGGMLIRSGQALGSGNSGVTFLGTGDTTSGASGQLNMRTGHTNSGASGSFSLQTGNITSAFSSSSSGNLTCFSGNVSGSGNSGNITIASGNTTTGSLGSIHLICGQNNAGQRGNIGICTNGTNPSGRNTITIGSATTVPTAFLPGHATLYVDPVSGRLRVIDVGGDRQV